MKNRKLVSFKSRTFFGLKIPLFQMEIMNNLDEILDLVLEQVKNYSADSKIIF